MPKASDAEMEHRIETVVDLILQGKTRTNILRHFAELSTRTVEYAMEEAWRRIREANDGSRTDKVTRHLKRLDHLAVMAIQKENVFAALKAYELQAKIMGLELAPAEQPARHEEIPQEELDRIAQEDLH